MGPYAQICQSNATSRSEFRYYRPLVVKQRTCRHDTKALLCEQTYMATALTMLTAIQPADMIGLV
jgi:hypothetical protein